MGLFIDSNAQADSPGVYALEVAPPKIVDGVPNGYVGLVGQFAWGPKQSVFTPASAAEFFDTFEPAGSPRSSSGYRAVMKRRRLPLKIVRALGTTSAAASASITGAGGAQTPTAKYHGVLGNSITVEIKAASGGDTAKRDVIVKLVDPSSGTTEERYLDQALPAAAAAGLIDVSRSKLLASYAIAAHATPAWPSNGVTTLTGGSNGTVAAADYTGTAGSADKGLALFETQDDVRVVVADDCGNTLRAATNAAIAAHVAAKSDRMGVIQADSDAANWAAVKALATGGLVSDRLFFVGAWAKIRDDAGNLQTSPVATCVASALANLEPHQSHAWWDDVATQYFGMIEEIVANFSTADREVRRQATLAGITLPVKLGSGKFALLHDRTTSQTSGKQFGVRRRVADYLALSLVTALESYVNGPNVVEQNREVKMLVDNFLEREKQRGRITAFRTDAGGNTPTSIGQGEYTLAVEATSPAPREKILLLFNVGPTVTVTEA